LGDLVEPDVAIVTSVAEGHLEGLRDLAGVLEEKTSLLDTVREGGWAVVADEPPELAARARERFHAVRTAGLAPAADEHPDEWSAGPEGIRLRWRGQEARASLLGAYGARNVMIALAAARVLNVAPAAAARAVAAFRGLPMRAERRDLGSLTLLVDCYNANPGSFRAAIDAASAMAGARPKAALVGSMLELGPESAALHRRTAKEIVRAGFAPIGASGAFAAAFEPMRDALGDRLVTGTDPVDLYAEFARRLSGSEVVLLKASRGVQLERVLPGFERDFQR
ncbi:MAG: glutamate ligase domain-containing protein, partial [Gemmatimonadota bacterium]